MTHRLIVALAAVTLMAATGLARAEESGSNCGAATAPTQEPKNETLSTQHADPMAGKTVAESVKPEKNGEEGDLDAAVRIDQKMSSESEAGYRRNRSR